MDILKVENLLSDLGVEFSKETKNEQIYLITYSGDRKVDGYSGFFTRFVFDKDGKFIEMGAWE